METELISEQEFLKAYDERCANIRKMIRNNYANGWTAVKGWRMELLVMAEYETNVPSSIKLKLVNN